MFIVVASRIQLEIEIFYLWLWVLLQVQAWIFERDNPGPKGKVIDTSEFRPMDAPPQALAGLLVSLPIIAPLVILGSYRVIPNWTSEFVTQGLFVAYVETLYMIVSIRTLWIRDQNVGVILWPVIFAFMHPAVRDPWLAGQFTLDSIMAFAYTVSFAVLFWVLWEGRTLFGTRYSRYFGAVTTWTSHLTINIFVRAFPLKIAALELFPLVMAWTRTS